MAFPHLPVNNIDDLPIDFTIRRGFEKIVEFARSSGIQLILQVLFVYMERYWFGVIGPVQFSVYRAEIRTNNFIESFHSVLRTSIGILQPGHFIVIIYKINLHV